MNSRTLIVILLIIITIILGAAAVIIGDRLSQGDINPDDTSAYDTPTITVTTTITTTPSISQCEYPNIQFWYGCPGEPFENCGNGEWVDGTTITVDEPELPFVLDVNCFDENGNEQTNSTITCELDGEPFESIDNWFARDLEITEEGTYTCRCIDRDDPICIDTDEFTLGGGVTTTPSITITTTTTPSILITTTPSTSTTPSPTIPVTALVSDEVDRIIIGLVMIVTAFVILKIGAADFIGEKVYNHLFYNLLKKDIKVSNINKREDK